ncbi:MAG TPA: hypothetical protein VFG63_10995 [Nocardioidaceae bacterium]|nr:hypothetical protein [Nocardioidaceae bacterium]
MSKERARRRAEREKEAAIRAAARAAEAERRERRAARRRTLRRITAGFGSTGRQTGILARRRRIQRSLLVALLVLLNLLVWMVRPDWEARLAALIVSVLAAPVLGTLLFRRA